MSAILLLSISIRMLATAWSILLVRRTRDFRMSFLTLMLCLMTLRQLLTLWMEFDSLTVVVAKDFIELPGLLVSIMAFLAVFGVRNFIHDMKRAEVALLGSELRYRTIFDSTAVAIWEEDFTELKKELDRLHPEERKDLEKLLATRPDFLEECISKVRILDVNPATVELFEAKSRDELRVSLRRTFVPESWETFRKVVAAIAQGKPRYEGETVVQTLRGKRCTVLFRMVVLPEVYGANRALINMMDITRLRQTEAALRESEARFRRLAEASFEGIFIHRDRIILDVNQTLLDLTGYTRDELVGRDGLCLVVPEDHELVMSQVVHRTEEPYEVTGLRKDGTTIPLEVRGKTVREAGNELRVVAIRDISERKKAEQLIERERNLLRTLIDNLPDSVYVKDADGRFALVNQELAKRVGVASPEQLTGKTDSDVYPEEIAKIYQARDLEVLKTGRVLANEESEILDSATGKRIYVLGTRVPLFDSDGSVVGLVGTHRDVTEQKEREDEIRRLNRELEDRVRQRTAELESVNRELESFTYSVSHDLRAPLRGINGFSQALLEDYGQTLDPQGKDYLRRIQAASVRMGHLIDDLLALAHVSRSKMTRKRVNLTRLVKEIVAELRQREPQRQVEVRIQARLSALGDPPLLRVLLTNLLENAWKFTSRHTTACIEFGARKERGKKVFFVRDDGAGFDMRYVSKLFGPFQRLHTQQEFEGTGVGLATVQRIVHRHGGEVWAEGEVEKGATFYFTLG